MKSPQPTMHDDLRADLAALRELVADVLWEIDHTIGFDRDGRERARTLASAGRDCFAELETMVRETKVKKGTR